MFVILRKGKHSPCHRSASSDRQGHPVLESCIHQVQRWGDNFNMQAKNVAPVPAVTAFSTHVLRLVNVSVNTVPECTGLISSFCGNCNQNCLTSVYLRSQFLNISFKGVFSPHFYISLLVYLHAEVSWNMSNRKQRQ